MNEEMKEKINVGGKEEGKIERQIERKNERKKKRWDGFKEMGKSWKEIYEKANGNFLDSSISIKV